MGNDNQNDFKKTEVLSESITIDGFGEEYFCIICGKPLLVTSVE